MKLAEDNATYKKSLTNAGIDSIELKDDKSSKREWKEVQLKISETGVMSITDISNTVHKRTTEIENLQSEKAVEETLTSIEVKKEDLIVENCNISKSSVEIPTLVIDAQMTNNSTIPDLSNAFLITSDVKSTTENSSIKNGISSLNAQHNGSTRQTNETENSAAPTKLQQDTREVKDCGQIVNIEDKPVLSDHKPINQPATQLIEKNTLIAEDKKGTDVSAKKLSINNNSTDFKVGNPEESVKECGKNEAKMENTGSKIDALSVKLQFQPKLGQINNTYSKKTPKEKRTVPQQCAKKSDVKSSTEDTKIAVKTRTNSGNTSGKASCSTANSQKSIVSATTSQNALMVESSSGSGRQKALCEKDNQSTNIDVQQALNLLEQKTNSMQTLAESVPKTISSTSPKSQCTVSNNTIATNENVPTKSNISTSTVGHTTSTFSYTFHDLVSNSTTLKPTLKNSNSSCVLQKSLGMPPVVSSTSNSQICSVSQFNVQPSSTGVYSTPVSLKNNYSNVSQNVTTVMTTATITATAMSKPTSGACSTGPPCPDAIPISLMKQVSMRKQEVSAKGTNLNEICAKIGSNTTGSKINDICAKIGENSKEKNRIETRGKSDVPDLLKINTKKCSTPSSNSDTILKHIPNIPNVPVYTPSSNATTTESSKSTLSTSTSVSVLAGSMPSISTSSIPTSSHMTQKASSLRKHSQPIGYKTLRDPPKSWNPTLSKNNYVAVKNQAKEMQNSASEGTSKQIPSKPAKIFKMRNMPRYLGNPASGVKPMYGITNDSKEKEQSATKSVTLSMMKIDPKTLSPIVSTINSSIVSPPPYSPNTRNYQTPFPRDICRNTGSPISPRNSPVNMLSTNPFIPSPTPNTNPRIIYSHFPPPFPDASRFPNPLIRSPIGIPPPSAFHSSLPPSINKLYQRSSYVPQTTGYSPVSSQPPTVQRIPPSTHSSSPKSPKASSPSSISSMSFNLGKAESQSPITSTVDSVALLLSKSVSIPMSPQRELNAFNLSKSGSLTSGSTSNIVKIASSAADTSNVVTETQISKQNFSSMSLNSATTTNAEISEKSSSSSSANERKPCKDPEMQKAQETTQSREESSRTKLTEVRCNTDIADNISSDKKQKNQAAKINGDVATEQHVSKKSTEDNINEVAIPVETTERDGQVERSSSREENSNVKNNIQTNINNSTASDSKNEDFGKTNEQIQGKKSEVQKNKAET